MPVYLPNDTDLPKRMDNPEGLIVACYCAAWCDTCKLYQPRFAQLSQEHTLHTFVWIDIEDHPELLGDEDVENFPTILVERNGQALFFGTMLPHIQQLDRLLQTLALDSTAPPVKTTLPALKRALASNQA